jgi:hypothetical protein
VYAPINTPYPTLSEAALSGDTAVKAKQAYSAVTSLVMEAVKSDTSEHEIA